MGGSVRIFVLDFFSKQMPRATTAGQLSHMYCDFAFVFSVAPGSQVGMQGDREKGTTSFGKLGSLTLYRTVPM